MVTPETGAAGQAGAMICGFLLAMVVGALCGYINGFIISKFGTPPMIVTLGTSYVFMGIAIVLTEGSAVTGFRAIMSEMAHTNIFNLTLFHSSFRSGCRLWFGIYCKRHLMEKSCSWWALIRLRLNFLESTWEEF